MAATNMTPQSFDITGMVAYADGGGRPHDLDASEDIGGGSGGPNITATAVSQDEINLGFSLHSTSALITERATSPAGPFAPVYYSISSTPAAKIYSHQPDTTYYFRARYARADGTMSAYSPIVSATTLSSVNEIYVSKAGDDGIGDGSLGSPYLTIQRAVHDAVAGDVINVGAGTYTEFASWPAADGGGDVNVFSTRAGVALVNSGTPTAPIVIQPAPGDEGQVFIDQGADKHGFVFMSSVHPWPDYIHIKGFDIGNCYHSAIWSSDNSLGNYNDGDELVSRGVVIEGCDLHDTTFDVTGTNSGAMRIDSHRDWTIRNNRIDASILNGGGYDQNGSGSIYSYNSFDSLIEFNDISGGYNGVYFKDAAFDVPTDTLSSTIRFNRITNVRDAFYVQAGEVDNINSARYNIHHNIMKDIFATAQLGGIYCASRLNIYNNFIDYGTRGDAAGGANAFGVSFGSSGVDVQKILDFNGNIVANTGAGTNGYFTESDATPTRTNVRTIDENIYEDAPRFSFLYSLQGITLGAWQSYSNPRMTAVNPDANGQAGIPLAELATDTANDDYTIPANSRVLAARLDGTNAGPYQFGNSAMIGRVA